MGGGGGLQYKRLMGMCRSMGSHFYDLIDYNGSHFQLSHWNGVAHFRIFGVRKVFIFTVSKRTIMFVL